MASVAVIVRVLRVRAVSAAVLPVAAALAADAPAALAAAVRAAVAAAESSDVQTRLNNKKVHSAAAAGFLLSLSSNVTTIHPHDN